MRLFEFRDLWRSYQKSNYQNWKGLIITLMYLCARLFCENKNKHKVIWFLSLPYQIFYRFFIEWILCVELPAKCKIGKGLIIDHGQGLVVNKNVIIGNHCRLRNSTTIGCKILSDGSLSPSPQIGNNVDIGANSVIIGDIFIGDNVKIGAGSVVFKDVPANCVILGNPASIISDSNN